MSLFEIDYVSGAAHELRLKQQQDQIMKALKELSIKLKLESQEVQKPSSVMKYNDVKHDSWLTFSSSYATLGDKNGSYSPYYENSQGQRLTKRRSSSSLKSKQWTAFSCDHQSSNILCCSTSNSQTTVCDDKNDSIKSTKVEREDERDVYGFKKPTKWIDADSLRKIEERNEIVMKKQLEKWQELILNADDDWPSIGPQLFRFVKDGIPRELRPKIWMHYSGANRKKLEHQGLYDLLLKQAEDAGKSNQYAAVIERDLCRTFPDNIYFSSDRDDQSTTHPMTIQMLRRVLLALSIHSPEIGYCQSFNFLAGLLVLLLDSEEDVFWMLHTIIHDYFPEGMFDTKMVGANIEQTVLMVLVYEKLPGVWAKIASRKCFWECEQENDLPPITLVTNHWFMTMFINILPIETVLCIWDCFFVGGGFKVLYQAALTIIKMSEESIWEADDSVDAFQILQNVPKKLVDGRHFIETIFSPSSIGADITMEDINARRRQFLQRKKSCNV